MEKGRKRLNTARGLSRKKMGINPVATVVLLVTILLGIGVIIHLWMTMEARAGRAIQIQSVKFEEPRTRIYVQNVGRGTVTIDSVQINDEKINIYTTNCTVASEETTTIREGQTAEVTINRSYQEKVHIKVVCKDGTSYEADWKPQAET